MPLWHNTFCNYATTIIFPACRGLNGPTSRLDVSRDDFTKPEIQASNFFYDPYLRPNAPTSIRVLGTAFLDILDKLFNLKLLM